MCGHKEIIAIPTIETSWGMADRYDIICPKCCKYFYKDINSNKVKKYIKKAKGENYDGN